MTIGKREGEQWRWGLGCLASGSGLFAYWGLDLGQPLPETATVQVFFGVALAVAFGASYANFQGVCNQDFSDRAFLGVIAKILGFIAGAC